MRAGVVGRKLQVAGSLAGDAGRRLVGRRFAVVFVRAWPSRGGLRRRCLAAAVVRCATIRLPCPILSASSTASASRAARLAGHQPIDHHFDVVPHLAVELQVVGQLHDRAVDAGPDEALLEQVDEQVAILALLRPNERRQHDEPRALGQLVDALDDLLARLGRDRPRALGAVPLAGAGVEHAQVVVDLGDRADGRARVLARRLLRDRNRGAQAADVVDVGLGHLPQKLPGEAGQAFDVAPLPFGIQRVERQRAFARAADAGQADQAGCAAARDRRPAGYARGPP